METAERDPSVSLPDPGQQEPRQAGGKPRLATFLDTPSKEAIVAGSVAGVFLIGVVDILTGFELSWFPFYLLPVSLAAWSVGLWAGVATSFLSAASWITADLLTRGAYSAGWIYYWNAATRIAVFSIVVVLLATLRRGHDVERGLARTDPVTGVANQRHFRETANGEIARARRFGHAVSIAYIDLDDFKKINEKLGHTGGDAVLRAVAEHLVHSVRAYDLVARVGGDEFAVLMPQTDSESARVVAASLPRRMQASAWPDEIPTTMSIGVATFERTPESVDEMILTADRLMYRIKQDGKNGVLHNVAR